MVTNKFQDIFNKRLKMIKKRLHMSEKHANRVEQTVQNFLTKIISENNWGTANPFQIPQPENKNQ